MAEIKTCSVLPMSPQTRRETSLLTDCDITKILERKFGSTNFRLVDWRLEPFNKTEGFLGQYYHLCITAQLDGETQSLQFFAKTPPPPHSPQFEFLQRFDTFNKEITFYTDLVRRMGASGSPKWIVECYFWKRNVIIVLEDATIDGYATLNKHVPYDKEHCVWVLRTLSRLHSRSLLLDERLRRESGQTIVDLYGQLLNDVLFVEGDDKSEKAAMSGLTGICAMIDLIEEFDDKEKIAVKRKITEWVKKIPRLLAPSKEHRNVICHRDVWATNIMFRHDLAGNINGCCLIDWQFFCYSPPAIDFACCLYLTTDRSTRDRHFDFFARTYYDSLVQSLAEGGLDVENYLSWTAFEKSYTEARNAALILASLNLQVMLIDNESIAIYFCNSTFEKLEEMLYGDKRADLVHHQCEKKPTYKMRCLEIIHEIKERLPEHPPNL
ncbi:PREDICTED: uncharacterized protein LOC108776090 [Cyphomyrmex costatus]|uniref:CHK kinase-like domain-containing protein n=1 Tax=Cyphomyrmex costatus TaxID=456900 RepID=A0A151IG58_9HYME|nr:PREDICTED: uncharacterized protein LOC108776090 [Cyphomyrmex costatus]KYN00207.1 hypothetical protein ALC62_09002 [Cyphomyrmex costatus]